MGFIVPSEEVKLRRQSESWTGTDDIALSHAVVLSQFIRCVPIIENQQRIAALSRGNISQKLAY